MLSYFGHGNLTAGILDQDIGRKEVYQYLYEKVLFILRGGWEPPTYTKSTLRSNCSLLKFILHYLIVHLNIILFLLISLL